MSPDPSPSDTAQLEDLFARQRLAWSDLAPQRVEELVAQLPAQSADDEVLLDLIYHEVVLRNAHGESPACEEYVARFPHLADQLRAQFEVHEALESGHIDLSSFGLDAASDDFDASPAVPDLPPPERIDRYRIDAFLGRGGFCNVYRGWDERLNRRVAVKLWRKPVAENRSSELLEEARRTAVLDHPGIVRVYDAGSADDRCFLVVQYIDGSSLAVRLSQQAFSPREAAELVCQVADALDHAHRQGVVHRDVSPANILVSRDGRVYLSDFGLSAWLDRGQAPGERVGGTLPYMAPEQLDGETHRVDLRTDIYGLGAVFYHLLCGKPPGVAALRSSLLRPREIRPELPTFWERICLKALATRPSDRYQTASELIEDLRWALAQDEPSAPVAQEPPPITLRGLAPFERQDAAGFQRLLPGPHDAQGLAESVRFWKRRIDPSPLPCGAVNPPREARELPERSGHDDRVPAERPQVAASPFRVGLIYGPSGTGKTSLVRAGLLPQLTSACRTLYVDATDQQLEPRLAARLAQLDPSLAGEASLVGQMARIRERASTGRKVVLVIDQLERWLHGRQGEELGRSELVAALRQADGRSLQCLLVVREDYWTAAAKLFEALDEPLDDAHNTRRVEAFDLDHARDVLIHLGRAAECMPPEGKALTEPQRRFLVQALSMLAWQHRVSAHDLSSLVVLTQGQDWGDLHGQLLGGSGDVTFAFLQQQFDSPRAPREQRELAGQAREVLQAMLPVGDAPSPEVAESELRTAAGGLPETWRTLIEILEHRLHLVAPVITAQGMASGHYRLLHDRLANPIGKWLAMHCGQTWRGRTRRRLERATDEWRELRQPQLLPGLGSLLGFALAVPRGRRTASQQAMLRVAWQRQIRHLAVVASGLLILLVAGSIAWHRHRKATVQAHVEGVASAAADQLTEAVERLKATASLARPRLSELMADGQQPLMRRMRAAEALTILGQPELPFLLEHLPRIATTAAETRNLRLAMQADPQAARQGLWRLFQDETESARKGRLATLLFELGDRRALRTLLAGRPDPTPRTDLILAAPRWIDQTDVFCQAIQESEDADLVSGLCLVLGRCDPLELSESEQQRVEAALADAFRTSPHGSVHSAAGWALRQWGRPLPPLPDTAYSAEGSRQWYVNGLGMTLIQVPAGTFEMGESTLDYPGRHPHRVVVEHPLFIATCEVTVQQFRQFQPEVLPDSTVSPSADHPMQSLTWDEAIRFCNWLSDREGLARCYRPDDEPVRVALGEHTVEWTPWVCDFAADGYRLPTEAEWEYACRAGTQTRFYFGDDAQRSIHFLRMTNNRIEAADPCGSRLPNRWGLFDMLGNVWELVWDPFGPFPEPADPESPERTQPRPAWSVTPSPAPDHARTIRGGGVATFSGDSDNAARGKLMPVGQRFRNCGFRIVRTMPPASTASATPTGGIR